MKRPRAPPTEATMAAKSKRATSSMMVTSLDCRAIQMDDDRLTKSFE
jgi:hypothetical protein